MKIDGFNILPVTSFSMAATTFVGQNYGAGNLKRVKNGMWVTLGMSVLYTLCTGTLLLAFQNPIMHLFTSDETVVAFGCSAMHYFCPFYFLLAILHGMAGAVRGTRPQRARRWWCCSSRSASSVWCGSSSSSPSLRASRACSSSTRCRGRWVPC